LATTLYAGDIAIEKSGDKDIQELIDNWVGMWNSYDMSMVDKLFLQDSDVSYFSSEKQGLIKGIEAIRDHHVEFGFVEGGKSQEKKLWIGEVHIQNYGDAAIIAGIWYFQRASEDAEAVQKGPFTFVCVRQKKEWLFAHLNFSEYK
jgi:ketosteroid isomerase-like protein